MCLCLQADDFKVGIEQDRLSKKANEHSKNGRKKPAWVYEGLICSIAEGRNVYRVNENSPVTSLDQLYGQVSAFNTSFMACRFSQSWHVDPHSEHGLVAAHVLFPWSGSGICETWGVVWGCDHVHLHASNVTARVSSGFPRQRRDGISVLRCGDAHLR